MVDESTYKLTNTRIEDLKHEAEENWIAYARAEAQAISAESARHCTKLIIPASQVTYRKPSNSPIPGRRY